MATQLSVQKAPWPLYQQVKSMILRRIESGHWPNGSKIPSENELVEMLGISRMTINRALRELTQEGRLIRKKGAGTFVTAEKPQFALLEIKSIAEEIASWGGQHHCEVVLLHKEKGEEALCRAMGLRLGASLFHSILVHKDRDNPIQLAERYVNPEMVPDYLNQDFTRVTPSNYLLEVVPVSEVEHVIETRIPEKQEKQWLQMGSEEPCLVLHRTTWMNDIVITKNRFIYPGTRYTIGGRFKVSDHMRQVTV